MGTFYFNAKDESRNLDVLSIHLLLTANAKGGRYTFFNLDRISRKVFMGNSNIADLDSVAFNSNIKRTRPVASLGAFYDVTKTQRASATINYQQTAFQSTGSATAYFNYMIGF